MIRCALDRTQIIDGSISVGISSSSFKCSISRFTITLFFQIVIGQALKDQARADFLLNKNFNILGPSQKESLNPKKSTGLVLGSDPITISKRSLYIFQ